MKKLFISVVLSAFFLTNSCFGYDFDKGEVSRSVSATVFKGGYAFFLALLSAIT